MGIPDLQTLAAELEQNGMLQRITAPVDPILEITEITDRVTKAGGPALLFENVIGHDFPLLINTYGTRERMCHALGVSDFEELANEVKSLIKPEVPTTLLDKIKKLPQLAKLGSLPPKVVRRGICQEVVLRDDEVDVTRLPAIKCWPHDGDLTRNTPDYVQAATERHLPTEGRYITLAGIYTIDPETGDRNIGMYRVQVFGPRLCTMHWHMHHDGARHFRKYKERGEKMPVAVVLGGPAIMPYAATCPLPPDVSELLFAGFLNRGAVELVPTVSQPNLQVPATAEFVIEGYIDPNEDPIAEGPFGDHTGFYSTADFYPKLHLTALTHRRKPLYPTTIVGKPPQEDFWLGKATERIFLPLLKVLIPDIVDYNLPMFGCFHNCIFVKIRKEYPMQARRVMSAIWGAGQMAFTKMIVVVDDHVDVHNQDEVLFQLCSNVDPKRDVVLTEGPLDILDHATAIAGVGGKIGFDATRKIAGEGPIRAWPDELEMSAEMVAQVSRRWAEYGIRLPGVE